MPKKRSKHYDFFSPNKNSNDSEDSSKKQTWKKIWKWIKIILIVFVIGTGFVGCAQSFALRSPVKIGTGFETYLKTADVSPNVEVFQYDKGSASFKRANNGKIIQANPYLAADSKKELESVKKQIEADGGNYYQYGSHTLGIQLRDSKGKILNNSSVYNNNNRYLVYARGDKNGAGAVTSYKNVTNWTDIYNINNWDWGFKKVTVKNADGKEIELNKKDHIKSIELSVLPNYILSTDNQLKFARDVFQVLYSQSAELFKKQLQTEKIAGSDSKTYWDEILSSQSSPRDGPALAIINSYIQNLAKQTNKSFSDSQIATMERVQQFANSNFIEYGKLTNYTRISNQKDAQDASIITFRNVSLRGNYVTPKDTILYALYGSAHRPATTWRSYWQYGPFYGLFVWPINQIVGNTVDGLRGLNGWEVIIALIIIVIITRTLTIIISYKSIFASQKQQELNAKKAKIEAKYAPYKGDKAMEQKKRNEINEMYKKNHANPYTAMISSLITLPILLVMFRIIQGSPEIKHSVWYGIQMSATSYQNLLAGEWGYLPIIIISVITQLIAQLLPRFLSRKKDKLRTNVYEREALKKSNKTQNILTIVFVLFGIIFQAGLQIYWIITGIWQILQTIAVYKIERTTFYKQKIMPRL